MNRLRFGDTAFSARFAATVSRLVDAIDVDPDPEVATAALAHLFVSSAVAGDIDEAGLASYVRLIYRSTTGAGRDILNAMDDTHTEKEEQ